MPQPPRDDWDSIPRQNIQARDSGNIAADLRDVRFREPALDAIVGGLSRAAADWLDNPIAAAAATIDAVSPVAGYGRYNEAAQQAVTAARSGNAGLAAAQSARALSELAGAASAFVPGAPPARQAARAAANSAVSAARPVQDAARLAADDFVTWMDTPIAPEMSRTLGAGLLFPPMPGFPRSRLPQAEAMRAGGEHVDDIWRATGIGWTPYPTVDYPRGAPFAEVSSEGAAISPAAIERLAAGRTITADELLIWPEYWTAAPSLRQTPISTRRPLGASAGVYAPKDDRTYLNRQYIPDLGGNDIVVPLDSIMFHELAHGAQFHGNAYSQVKPGAALADPVAQYWRDPTEVMARQAERRSYLGTQELQDRPVYWDWDYLPHGMSFGEPTSPDYGLWQNFGRRGRFNGQIARDPRDFAFWLDMDSARQYIEQPRPMIDANRGPVDGVPDNIGARNIAPQR